MSQDRDPFELLPRFVDPEPDPVIMNATIAQSREAFSRGDSTRQKPAQTLWSRLRQSANWLVPTSAGAVALIVAVVVAPNLAPNNAINAPNEPVMADRPDAGTPEQPTLARGPEQTSSGGGIRMGMQPAPQQDGAQASTARGSSTIFEGSNVRVEARATSFALELYLPDIGGDRIVDSQGLLPGEEAEVIAAFQVAERNIVAIQLNADGVIFWRAYRPVEGAYGRDGVLSALISDAPDEAEAQRRLEAQ